MMIEFFNIIKFPLFWRRLGKVASGCALAMTMLLWPAVLPAQAQTNGVTVSNLVVGAGTVTFEVSWDRNAMPSVWSDSVWVFVDYNDAGVMRRLELTGATLTETSAPGFSRTESVENNSSGVWVVGNARSVANTSGSFSATVQLLTATANFSGACVYASNYPPVGRFTTDSDISFTGTPMYNLTFKREGNVFTLPSGGTYLLPADDTLISFVDATGAPGIIVPHVDYCLGYRPGVLKGPEDDWRDPSCAVYVAGAIGGEGFLLPSCAQYVPGGIGGAGDAAPSCATYRTGSIGGLSFVSSNCESYVAGFVGGADIYDTPLSCASYAAGAIGGEGFLLPSCAQYAPGGIGGKGDAAPSCATYRTGSIGGLSFVGTM